MEDKKQKIPVANELTDELLEKVSGGTGVEEEEEVPTYVDEWAAYEAIYCEGKEYTICNCGLRVPVTVRNCPRCGRRF